jgi:hypothetical protein
MVVKKSGAGCFNPARRLQWDYRLGGVPRLVLATDEELMQIPDEIRKCVAFVARKNNDGSYDKGATVFLVGYPLFPSEPDGPHAFYAITARHVIEQVVEHGDGIPYCCINTRQDGIQFLPVPCDNWVFNEDERVDVAVAHIPLDARTVDFRIMPTSMFMNSMVMETEKVGIGDDLFFPGLFRPRPGEAVNLPIIRIGNIAAMPSEPIRSEEWGIVPRAYLIEARSIGGLSGSPVFWSSGIGRVRGDDLAALSLGRSPIYLIGLIHGHYNAQGKIWDYDSDPVLDGSAKTSENAGIAIVVPVSDILDTLNVSRLESQREEFRQQVALQRLAESAVLDTHTLPPES